MIRKIWVPAILMPLGVIAVIVGLIVGIGELLLALEDAQHDSEIAGALIILLIITVVAIYFARRVNESEQ